MPKKKKKQNGNVAVVPKPAKVRIRTYRHGLGDCHLLSFVKADESRFHMLIDCGVVNRTPDPGPLMKRVAEDIVRETGGVLDVVVATHQHTDHLSGFRQAADEFNNKLKMKRLWLAWTEDPSNPLGKKIQRQLVKKLAAIREAAQKLRRVAPADAAEINTVLDFFGPAAGDASSTQAILDSLQKRNETEIAYHDPGDGFVVPGLPNVRVYVLGPPTDPIQLKMVNPRKSKRDAYEMAEIASDMLGLVDALGHEGGEEPPELSYPFEAWYRRPASTMKRNKFYKEHYFRKGEGWRKIDNDWLQAAETLALALNNFTNNTSLALAFEFIDSGEVLLFPGDAQIGSWLTWSDLTWKVADGNGEKRNVKVADLFPRVVFYKGSHHASYNGTLTGYTDGVGLEEMTHRDLVCVVPVDRAMSKKMGWDRTLPWAPLLQHLKEKTRGRLVLTDRAEIPPTPETLDVKLSNTERERFAKQVFVTDDHVDYVL
ncbi:MAG TPA: MBL fold metallo-hydrolase [Chthoniobacterales bacterium]|nr:MBL fold metallo-hydrolase [Chthoniobacterales bacterium]